MSRGDSSQQLKSMLCTTSAWPVISPSTRVVRGRPFCGAAHSTAGNNLGKARGRSAEAPCQALAELLPGGSAVLCGQLLMQLPATGKSISSKELSWLQAAYQHKWKRGSGSAAACLQPQQPSPSPTEARKGATSSLSSVKHHNTLWESGRGLVTVTKQA